MEDRSGKTLDALITGANSGSVKALRWVVWASLQDRHALEFQNIDDVGVVMDAIGGVTAARKQIGAFLTANIEHRPEEQETEGSTEKAKPTWREMYIQARTRGVAAEAFWSLSLLELWREVAAWNERERDEWNRDMRVAWTTAALSNQRKLPSLDSLIRKANTAAPKKQTWQDMKAYMKALSEATTAEGVKDGVRARRTRK